MGDLTTLENLKKYMRITGDKDDAILTRLIKSTSSFIQVWLNRDLELKTHTEKFSGTGQDYHMCRNYPLFKVDSIKVDGRDVTEFDFDDDSIYLEYRKFSKGRHNCEITYQAGFGTIPPDVEQACIEIIAIKYKQIESINLSSKSMGGETTSFIIKEMPDFAKVVLNKYLRVSPI